jgi:hypothetical protein
MDGLGRDRERVRDAQRFLEPLFGLDRMPLPAVRRGPQSSLVFDQPSILPSRRRYAILLEPRENVAVHGEEAGHYLHGLANPGLETRIHFGPWPRTREGALEYLALRNWEECIGALAGTLYASHRHGKVEANRNWLRRRKRECREMLATLDALCLEEQEAAYSRHRARRMDRLRKEYAEDEWSLLEHACGCRAADDILAADPFGNRLAELVRYDGEQVRAYLDGFRSWRRYWQVLERQYGGRLVELLDERTDAFER